MSITFSLGDRLVGSDQPPFIIAEMSGNHNQSLDRALELVDAAAQAGAHAVKLQTYTADTITLNVREGEFTISDEKSLWKGNNLHDLYSKAYTPWEWHAPIMERAKAHGMMCFSSPFDESAVDFLLQLDVPAFKIASFENNHLPLIRKVAATGKPMIISTGMASVAELGEAVAAAREGGCRDLVLLKCTSSYPAPPDDTNIRTIPHMRELFGCEVGLSDHTLGVGVSVASVALGASVIEKHFTLARADGGVDSAFSLEPHELAELVRTARIAQVAVGQPTYGSTASEASVLGNRRSLYVVKPVARGEALTLDNVRSIRPARGIRPKHLDAVLGRRAVRDLAFGEPLAFEMIEGGADLGASA